MPNMGVSLTERQRVRLEELAKGASRSMSNMIGFLIDLEYEQRAAYQERSTENVESQKLEPEQIA